MLICYIFHPDNIFDIVMFREGHRPSPTLTYGIRPAKSQFVLQSRLKDRVDNSYFCFSSSLRQVENRR